MAGAGRRGGALAAGGLQPSRPSARLRVNTLRADPAVVLEALREAGADARRPEVEPPLGLEETILIEGSIAAAMPQIEAGELVPQSRGSAAVVELLDPRPGEQVLDLCAGPGIKTGQIAARMEDRGEVISVEVDPDARRGGGRPRPPASACAA